MAHTSPLATNWLSRDLTRASEAPTGTSSHQYRAVWGLFLRLGKQCNHPSF